MRSLTVLSTLLALTSALTFTSPFPGTTVDITTPWTVNWIPASTDPSTFALTIINTDPDSSAQPQVIATSLQTSKGTYTIPANTINSYGTDFELVAVTATGTTLGTSVTFGLAQGVYSLSTSNGILTIVGTPAQLGGSSATTTSASATTTASNATTSSAVNSTATKTSSASAGVALTSTLPTTSSSSTSSSSAPATSSTSSNTSGNLGFDSAADVIRGSVLVSCAAFLGALAMLA